MAIENNLPIILDTVTHSEDGLMSYKDKIKLDSMGENLDNKLSKDEKIKSSQLDISSDESKIQPDNLSRAVIEMMTGQTQASATIKKNGVTTETIANGAVTIDKIDKRFLLGNVVSPRPLNFAFDTKKVTINIPKGSLLMLDAVTKRDLVTNSNVDDVIVDINYPAEFDGLNYIVSDPAGTISMINHRKSNTISSTNSIVALVYLSSTFEAAVVMHGSYTINGLAQGIGTESAAIMSTGKIVFDQLTGIIDFTEAAYIHLIIGGVFNRSIENQASIRLADYSDEVTYVLYWNHSTQALETSQATISNTDTDIAKIALIKDGRIIPFVDTGIFYSKPYTDAPYYTEYFDHINNICLSSEGKINIVSKDEHRLEVPEETYVCLNDTTLKVENLSCKYENRIGLHYILFNLDTNEISCRFHTEAKDVDSKNIIVGTIWVNTDSILVSGNFQYTIDGKTPYEDDLSTAENNIKEIQNIVAANIEENEIIAGKEIYMISGEELPIYESSMLIRSAEGIKPAISYNKNNDIMSPRNTFFTGDILIDKTVGDKVSLLAYDKYNNQSYLKKDLVVNKVPFDAKMNHTVKILCIGDNLINDGTAYHVNNKLTTLGVKTKMLGTMVNSQVYGEGRNGWFYSTFVGASGRGLLEGKINPQVSKASSSVLLNPFVRIANADDKANYPNDCYRATGAYIEKTYYTDSDKNGAFYIFDFANYMEVQGIETPDVVVIAIKPELCSVYTEDIVSTNMMYMRQLVNGIRAALPDTYIALVPQYSACTHYDKMWEAMSKMVSETVKFVDTLEDENVKVLSAWLHMNREFGTKYIKNTKYDNLYEEFIKDQLEDELSETAKIELANVITSFIMNI